MTLKGKNNVLGCNLLLNCWTKQLQTLHVHTCRSHDVVGTGQCFMYVVFPTARKKGRVLARKRALLMREIHPKGHFC